jgi:transposase InsO family protein
MPLQGNLGVERMCQLAQVSRPGFYRYLQEKTPVEEDMDLRSAIQQIALEHRRRYGYRRISAELRRRGMLANHKRVVRIMREDNLLAVQPRQFVVTTDAHHELEIYLNLARRMKLSDSLPKDDQSQNGPLSAITLLNGCSLRFSEWHGTRFMTKPSGWNMRSHQPLRRGWSSDWGTKKLALTEMALPFAVRLSAARRVSAC